MEKYIVVEKTFNDGESNKEQHLFDTEEQAVAKFNEIKNFYKERLCGFSEEKSNSVLQDPYVRKTKSYFSIRSTEYNYDIYIAIRKKSIK
jgi:hypothetical protein